VKDICLCISAVAVVEIPTGQWSNFVEIMSGQGDQNDNMTFKMAGIYNLGLIMETLIATDFQNQNDLGLIWNTMLNNIVAENLDLARIVSKSIAKLSAFSQRYFEVED
jgi:hypothetical protein